MKHKILLILISFLFIGCNCENDTNDIVKPKELPNVHFKIIKIGNHQYLYNAGIYNKTLCHYEDCDYCKKHRNY